MGDVIECDHGSDPRACPVRTCNPTAALDPFGTTDIDFYSDGWRAMIAQHHGRCLIITCTDTIIPGDPIRWSPDVGAVHTGCVS